MTEPGSEGLDDAAAQHLVRQLIARQSEDRSLDYKAAMSFSKHVKGKLLKCIMAFANTRDGGYILIGVAQRGTRFEPEGVTEQQARSFDPTTIGDFARRYCSTQPRVSTREVTIDRKRIVLLRIAEFTDEPIVCTSDLHDESGKTVLRRGHIYVRTEDARCVEIDSSDTMRAFLDLALQKRGEGLVEQVRRLVGAPTVPSEPASLSAAYADQLEAAEAMFKREQLTAPTTYWFCSVMPATFEAERITNARLREIRMLSEVALRGWNFPHTDREHIQAFEDGVESVTHWSHHHEASRFYRSGLFTWRKMLREDGSSEYEGMVSFVSTIYTFLEAFLFASRYTPMVANSGEFVVNVGLESIGDHQLLLDTNGFRDTKTTAARRFARDYLAPVERLRASYRELATDASQRFFDLFDLEVPDSAIEHWQSRLLKQAF